MVRGPRYVTSAVLASVAGLHVSWGLGSSFPFPSRAELADAVVGTDAVPPPIACHAVAAMLAVAGLLVADVPIGSARLRRTGRHLAAGVLALRAIAGFAGRTDALSPGSTSSRFRRLDRRLYSPLCFALAIGSEVAVDGRRARSAHSR